MKGIDDIILNFGYSFFKKFKLGGSKVKKIDSEIYFSNSKTNKALFILPQWRQKQNIYRLLIRKLQNNYTCILYRLPYDLLSDNINKTLKNFEYVESDIIKIINNLSKNGYTDFSILAQSTSTSIALMAANKDLRIRKIILNSTGDSFADCLWKSKNKAAQEIIKKIRKNGYSLSKLRLKWKPLANVNNLNNMGKRNIMIFLSKNDRIIPYENGLDFINTLKEKNINYTLIIDNYFGHYISSFKRVIFFKPIIDFLEE